MQALLMESSVRATLLIAAVAVVLWALRIKTAAVRHAAWAGVAVTMLLLPALVAWGPHAKLRWLPVQEIRHEVVTLPAEDPRYAGVPGETWVRVAETSAPKIEWSWATSLLGVYLFGLGVFLLRLNIGAARVGRLVRGVAVWEGRLTHASVATPITAGWWRPVVILPPSWPSWPAEQLNAVLAHEAEHACRRDPFFQRLALLNRAIFWFHPLAWWLERELSGLAEEACDDAVLAQGHDAGNYSTCLVQMARSVHSNGARVLGMAMPGQGLPFRLKRILSEDREDRITPMRLAATMALCACMGFVVVTGTIAHAQVDGSVFEVTSVKRHINGSGYVPLSCSNGRFISVGAPLTNTIEWAYDLPFHQFIEMEEKSPLWVKQDGYDIEARAAGPVTEAQCQRMVQALLADRFQMAVHWESKEGRVLHLVVAPGGYKLQKVTDTDQGNGVNITINGQLRRSVPGAEAPRGQTMAELARLLSLVTSRVPVNDKTGLDGVYKINLAFSTQTAVREFSDPDVGTALQRQLGLKLEEHRGPVEMMIVDRIERPDSN